MKRLTYAFVAVALLSAPAYAAVAERHLEPSLLSLVNEEELKVYNGSGSSIAANKLVAYDGWNETYRCPSIVLADADAAGKEAIWITHQAIGNGSVCENGRSRMCVRTKTTLTAQNTNGLTVGDKYYLSETAGAYTSTAPTDSDARVQEVGVVRVVSSTVGRIEINLRNLRTIKVGSNEVQSGSVDPASIGLTVRAATNLAAGDLVWLDSYNATDGVYTANIADADVAGAHATYVATGTIASGATGRVYKKASVAFTTTGATAGDPVYLTITGTTTNTMSLTPPTGGDDRVQIVGRVQVVGASGPVLVDLLDFVSGIAEDEIQANSVTLTKLVDFTGQGYILRGGAAGAPEEADFGTSGCLGLGDGTDFTCTVPSGLIDISAAGKTTLDARYKAFHFRDPAMLLLYDMSAVAGVAATNVNHMQYPEGVLFEYLEEALAGAVYQTTSAYGIDFGMDDTDNDGVQIYPPIHTGGESFTGQTDAFYVKMTFRVEDASGTDPLCLCVLTPQANGDIDAVADIANYGGAGEEVACMCTGTGAGTDPAVIHQVSATNGGGIQNNAFTTSNYQCADATTYTWEIDVAASGAFTVKVDGSAPGGGGAALTLTADEFFPRILHASSSDVNASLYISLFEWGLQ